MKSTWNKLTTVRLGHLVDWPAPFLKDPAYLSIPGRQMSSILYSYEGEKLLNSIFPGKPLVGGNGTMAAAEPLKQRIRIN